MAAPTNFITAEDLHSLAVVAPVCWAAGSVFQSLTSKNPRYFVLLLGVVIAAINTWPFASAIDVFITFLNGLLIFVTASGVSAYTNKEEPQKPEIHGLTPQQIQGLPQIKPRRTFLTSWFS
jgi:hypothetical protein